MQLEQIIIRPQDNQYLVQYSDNVGRLGNLVSASSGNPVVEALVSDARGRLPAEQDRPDKSEIQQEIEELEYRLKMLKESIGQV